MMKIHEITGNGLDGTELIDVMAHQSGPALNWLEDLGVVWERVYKGGNENANADVTPAVAHCHGAQGGGYAIWVALESGVSERRGVTKGRRLCHLVTMLAPSIVKR